MSEVADMWLNILALCTGLAGIGFVAAVILNCKPLGCLLAGLAMIGVTFGAVVFGAVGVIHALKGCNVQHIQDGRNEVYRRPLSWSVQLPPHLAPCRRNQLKEAFHG